MASAGQVAAPPLLEMRGITKSYPGVLALDDVDLKVKHGEVVALLGENGAGKSTLIKMLGGAHVPDAGTILLDGAPVSLESPARAGAAGIGVIYQEGNLVPGLTAVENIFLGRESGLGRVRRGAERRKAEELFNRIGATIPLDIRCGSLSIAQQQIVEIAKALSQQIRLIVMDEPSSSLAPEEVKGLLSVIRDLTRQGIGVIYISHRLDEIFQVANRVVVLRDGRRSGSGPVDELTRQEMIEMMVGRQIADEFPARSYHVGPVRLEVDGLCRGTRVRNVSFQIRRGEILGLTGLVGAGRTETARLLFGADRPDSGSIKLDGRALTVRSPRDAIRAGICLLPEDRKAQGLVLGAGIRENFGLPSLSDWSRWGIVSHAAEQTALDRFINRLQIKSAHPRHPVNTLSGGNQQKLVLAKWLQRDTEIVIFDEPTRGIDVGTKYEIYVLMNELARLGKSILMISSELPEVLAMSDRILVMHEGRITGEVTDVPAASQQQLMDLAVA